MHSRTLALATERFLSPYHLSDFDLLALLHQMSGPGVDAADIYFQYMAQESFSLEDGLIKEGSYHIDQGVGLRVISGEKTGFAYSDDLAFSSLTEAAKAARSIVKHAGEGHQRIQGFGHRLVPALYVDENPLQQMTQAQKLSLLQICDRVARAESKVTQVMASLSGAFEIILVAALDGTLQADVRPLVRLNVQVIAQDGSKRETGFSGGGGRFHYQHFVEEGLAEIYAQEAVRRALTNLVAEPAPAGPMPVVLGPGWPGVLLHEAVGHGLEGDFNRKGSSAFSGRVGERVASSVCTVVDDGTLVGRRGSLTIDDEGTPTSRTVLIENGLLKGYLHDKHNAHLMGTVSTGNGRRESYAHLPLPRMTNTFLLPGFHKPEDLIRSVDQGIYAVNFGGGSVDITSGKFVFSASEAYRIEKGQVTAPIKGATLIGQGPEVMMRIRMVANDLALDSGIGVCGKAGQSVPVGVGQPTVLVEEMTVGGTDHVSV